MTFFTVVLQPRHRYPFGRDSASSETGAADNGGGAATKENVGVPGGVNDAGGGRDRGATLPDPRRLVAVLQEMSSRKRERSRRVSTSYAQIFVKIFSITITNILYV